MPSTNKYEYSYNTGKYYFEVIVHTTVEKESGRGGRRMVFPVSYTSTTTAAVRVNILLCTFVGQNTTRNADTHKYRKQVCCES